MSNLVGKLMDYESGELGDTETIELFAELVASGTAWQLQGSYGRMATALINGGYISPEGEVLATVVHVDTEEDPA